MNEHPVWHVYDELRNAKLNGYYYGALLAKARRWNTARELLLAATGSTGVAGVWLFATPPGPLIWKLLLTTAALLSVYNSVTRPSEVIRKLEIQVSGWAQLEFALAELRRRIHETGRYDAELQRQLDIALNQKRALLETPDTNVNEPLRSRCFASVNQELPPDLFFVPDQPSRQLPSA
jgi:hypothetical protein